MAFKRPPPIVGREIVDSFGFEMSGNYGNKRVRIFDMFQHIAAKNDVKVAEVENARRSIAKREVRRVFMSCRILSSPHIGWNELEAKGGLDDPCGRERDGSQAA